MPKACGYISLHTKKGGAPSGELARQKTLTNK